MKWKNISGKKLLYSLLVALLLLTAFAYPRLRAIEVQTARAERGTVREYVFEEAQTQLDILRVISAPITGAVKRIPLETGDELREGELITTIDDDEMLNAIAGAEARVNEIKAHREGLSVKVPKKPELESASAAVDAAEKSAEAAALQVETAALELEYRRKQYERISRLHESGAATSEQYDLARFQYDTARNTHAMKKQRNEIAAIESRIAALNLEALRESLRDTDHLADAHAATIEQIEAELDTLRLRRAKTRIRAPITGVIIARHIESDTYVQAGTPLAEIGNLDSVDIRSDILSADIAAVAPGQHVIIEGGVLGDQTLTGTVRRIEPHGFTKISALGIEQQRFRTLIEFDNSEAKLPPGADIDVRIIIHQRDNTLHIPAAALFMTADGPSVFRIDNGRAVLARVDTGLAGDEKVEIVSGLNENDTVLVRPPAELEPGERVRTR